VNADDNNPENDKAKEQSFQKANKDESSKSTKLKVPWEPLKPCGNLYLVFEYVDHDLGGLIDAKHEFSLKAIKTIMKQLFEVLDFLFEKKVLHRDIKCSNILISNTHQIKLADFGLARTPLTATEGGDMTNNVITMWYKPPELVRELSFILLYFYFIIKSSISIKKSKQNLISIDQFF